MTTSGAAMDRRDGKLRQIWRELSLTDKLLPLLVIVCIVLGVVLSVYVPSARRAFEGAQILNVSVPLAVGLIVMMVPPLCKVEWENIWMLVTKKYLQNIIISLVLNWIICPVFMFGLAWLTLFDKTEYREGIIMIGLARCIAMVLVWNTVSDGDPNLCAVLVLINSTLQMVLYAPYQIFFCYVTTGHFNSSNIVYSTVAKSVAFFLGIPVGLGFLIRMLGIRTIGIKRYQEKVLPWISPFALAGLLYTIIVIFIAKGNSFIHEIGTSIRCFIPLVLYFPITFLGTFFFMRWMSSRTNAAELAAELQSLEAQSLLCGCEDEKEMHPAKIAFQCSADYGETITQSFTAASNNFELSIAVAISLYGNGSRQAIASVYGPLLEIPVMLVLCFVAKYLQAKFIWRDRPQ